MPLNPPTVKYTCLNTVLAKRWNLLRLGEPHLLKWTKRSQYTTSYPNTAKVLNTNSKLDEATVHEFVCKKEFCKEQLKKEVLWEFTNYNSILAKTWEATVHKIENLWPSLAELKNVEKSSMIDTLQLIKF